MNASTGPPLAKKPPLFKRIFMAITPKRFHKYLTPEVFAAWHVSSYVTIVQYWLVEHWKLVTEWFSTFVLPTLSRLGADLKVALAHFVALVFHSGGH